MHPKDVLNLAHFRKVHEDAHTTTLAHPSGHSIKVAHGALSEPMQAQLKAMPIAGQSDQKVQKLADGGEAKESPADWQEAERKRHWAMSSQPDPDAAPADSGSPLTPMPGAEPPAAGPMVSSGPMTQETAPAAAANAGQGTPSAPEAPATPTSADNAPTATNMSVPMPAAPAAPTGPTPMELAQKGILGGYGLSEQGVRGEAAAQGALGKQQAANEISHQQALDDLAITADADYKEHEQEVRQSVAEIEKGQIDPDHYMNTKLGSTGAKIRTAVGMLIAGLGSGLTGGENPVIKQLNENINRDIEAQRTNLQNKHTVLGAMERLYGDKQVANNIYRATEMERYLSAGRQAIAQNADPMARAVMQQRLGPLEVQKNQYLQQAAMQTAIQKQLASGNLPVTQAIELKLPKEQHAQALKEADEMETWNNKRAEIGKVFDKMNSEQTLGNVANPMSYGREKANRAELVQLVMDASPSKRLTKESVEQEIAPLEIKSYDNAETRKAKQRALMDVIQTHRPATPLLRDNGLLPPDVSSKFNPKR